MAANTPSTTDPSRNSILGWTCVVLSLVAVPTWVFVARWKSAFLLPRLPSAEGNSVELAGHVVVALVALVLIVVARKLRLIGQRPFLLAALWNVLLFGAFAISMFVFWGES